MVVVFLFSTAAFKASAEILPSPGIAPNSKALFASFDAIDVRIEAPFQELIQKKMNFLEAKKLRVQGRLFTDGKEIPVEIRLRGFSSLQNCNFPKFTLYLDETAIQGTIFEKVKKVDVATHCDLDPTGKEQGAVMYFGAMKYNHREALLYKWAEILRIPTYASRPANMTYKDTAILDASEIKAQGFFVEHLDSFVKRTGGIEIRAVNDGLHVNAADDKEPKFKNLYVDLPQHPQIDRQQLARIAFFNAFIANNDWRLRENEIWNLKLIELPNGSWFPIPMDFNLSGLMVGQTGYPMMLYDSIWESADPELKRQTAQLYVEKLPELGAIAVSTLKNDPEGLKFFQALLDRRAGELKLMKSQFAGMK